MPRAIRRAPLEALLVVVAAAAVLAYAVDGAPSHGVAAAGDCTADPSFDAEEQAFLQLINDYRAANGRAPLAPSTTLSKSAQWKSQDMGANAYFAHDDPFRSWVDRIRDCGYTYNAWLGENIAAGVSSAQGVFDLWRASPGHDANMLGEHYTAIGIGRAYVAGSPWGWYWTTDFGSVSDGWSSAPPAATPTSTVPPAVTATPTATAAPSTPTATRTATPAPSATSPAPSAIHIGDLDGRATGKNRWTARVTIVVHDTAERPVAGATVSGRWSTTTNVVSCTTDTSGTCSIQLGKVSAPSISFGVTSVSAPGKTYGPAANHDPDGSSDGTTVVVVK